MHVPVTTTISIREDEKKDYSEEGEDECNENTPICQEPLFDGGLAYALPTLFRLAAILLRAGGANIKCSLQNQASRPTIYRRFQKLTV